MKTQKTRLLTICCALVVLSPAAELYGVNDADKSLRVLQPTTHSQVAIAKSFRETFIDEFCSDNPGYEFCPEKTPALNMCFGYRGNGSSVFATIGGIARLLDQYGAPKAIVGTSSGSVAAFLTESLLMPRLESVFECDGCTQVMINERRSFMLKSFPLVAKAVGESDGLKQDFEKIEGARRVYETIMALAEGLGLGGNPEQKADESSASASLLNSDVIKGLLNNAALKTS